MTCDVWGARYNNIDKFVGLEKASVLKVQPHAARGRVPVLHQTNPFQPHINQFVSSPHTAQNLNKTLHPKPHTPNPKP